MKGNMPKHLLKTLLYLTTLYISSLAEINSGGIAKSYTHQPPTINTVSLTQQGYIQFLKYIVNVPPLTEYTFCIWILSNNLKHSHPVFSYSKEGDQRLIRFWISPRGFNLNLEILNQGVFEFPAYLQENVWYHLCQSWSSYEGAWNLFLNGKLVADGVEPRLAGVAIPGGGDVVIGQEYTDVDKGYEDGIEGDVYGFNFVLASTISLQVRPIVSHPNFIRRNSLSMPQKHTSTTKTRRSGSSKPPTRRKYVDGIYPAEQPLEETTTTRKSVRPNEIPPAVGYFAKPVNRKPRGIFDMLRDMLSFFGPYTRENIRVKTIDEFNIEEAQKLRMVEDQMRELRVPPLLPHQLGEHVGDIKKLPSRFQPSSDTAGVLLVELSYNNCALGKGAPVSGERVLISWTKSTVRVYGGAMMHDMLPFCVV